MSPHFSPAYLGLSVSFFSCVYLLGRLLLPLLARYRLWSKEEQYHARGIVPSSTFILVIVPMSLWALLHDIELRETRVVGSTEWSRMVIHIAAGYFVYDSTIVLIHVKLDGLSYLIHGVVCLVTYGLAALFDVYHYYGPTFLIFETTTIFINMKWCFI